MRINQHFSARAILEPNEELPEFLSDFVVQGLRQRLYDGLDSSALSMFTTAATAPASKKLSISDVMSTFAEFKKSSPYPFGHTLELRIHPNGLQLLKEKLGVGDLPTPQPSAVLCGLPVVEHSLQDPTRATLWDATDNVPLETFNLLPESLTHD